MTIDCPACSGKVADSATQCVHCGAIIKESLLMGALFNQRGGSGRLKYAARERQTSSTRNVLSVVGIFVGIAVTVAFAGSESLREYALAGAIGTIMSVFAFLKELREQGHKDGN